MNALITAEGAVEIALQNSGKTLFGSNVLLQVAAELQKLIKAFEWLWC